jgi:hypothetical protein
VNQLHEGWDYRLYKICVWGGLALIVVYFFVAVLVFDVLGLPGTPGFPILIGPMMLWFAGILLYWWWVILFKGNSDLEELSRSQQQGVPGIKALKSWSTLHQAMAIQGGDVEAFIKNEKKQNGRLSCGTAASTCWCYGFFVPLSWALCKLSICSEPGFGRWGSWSGLF